MSNKSSRDHAIQLAMLEEDIDRMYKQRLEIELLVSDLLSDRGEDELVFDTCDKVLHIIRNK